MSSVIGELLPVFILIVIGYAVRAAGIVTSEAFGQVNRFGYFVLYPAFLFTLSSGADLSGGEAGPFILGILLGFAVLMLISLATRPLYPAEDGPAFTSVFQGSVRWNGFVLLAAAPALYGASGPHLIGVAFGPLVLIVNLVCVIVLARWGRNGANSTRAIFDQIIANPLILGCAAGLLAQAFHVRDLGPVSDVLNLLGQAAMPIAIVCVGAGLDFKAVRAGRLLLKSHGTCNTVTAMSQILAQMTPDERRRSAAIMVSQLYTDLQASVRRDLERRQPMVRPGMSLREMIAGKEFLFADGNYHIDVSHLHSIVGFARHLQKDDPELLQAVELAQYGSQLSEHLRYPADVPFDDYYVASEYFLKALAGREVDEAIAYFTQRLNQEPDVPDKRMIAFVLVDLAQRVGRMGPALETAAPHLNRMDDPNGFSFTASCVESGRLDLLEATARENDDVLAMATILLSRR